MRSLNHTVFVLALLAVTSSSWAGETSPETTFTISGCVGVRGVTLQGLPGTPLTNESDYYTVKVPQGWSGTVIPKKLGYKFSPPQRRYEAVTGNSRNDDYAASILFFTISGNVGLADVVMEGLPGRVVTDARGFYRAKVEFGWAGTVAPLKQGCTFEPARRRYLKITADKKGDNYTVRGLAVSPPSSSAPSSAEVLVIPASEIDPKMLAEMREDMQVMIHIWRETLSEPRMILGILYEYGDIFGHNDRGTRAFYLEGYGALFVMEVDFPFSFPSEAGPEEAPGQEVDPVWQRARQRLRSPGTRRTYGQTPGDEMSFEQFKADLVKMLKHAANIRHVDPDENVILTIIGQDAGAGQSNFSNTRDAFGGAAGGTFGGGSYSTSGGSFGPAGGSTYATSRSYASGSAGGLSRRTARQGTAAPASTTVLTIQAKKVDVDAFSQGEIDFETFQKRVKVFTY